MAESESNRDLSYGLLCYDNSYNLGDEIQSIASQQYLPQIDALIDRDTNHIYPLTSTSTSTPNFPIKVIYNGWFDGQYCHFPPPDTITPLFTSFHINETDHSQDHMYDAIKSSQKVFVPIASHVDYLKKYEPIGCRDLHTIQILSQAGILAYFSGCLTLTLPHPCPYQARSGDILVVDAHIQCPDIYHNLIPKHIRKQAICLSQALTSLKSHADKMVLAQNHLQRLATAKLVITSRLHTALPCLAFKTPVIFLNNDLSDVRFKGLSRYLKTYTHGDSLDIDIDNYQGQPNSDLDLLINHLRETTYRTLGVSPQQTLGHQYRLDPQKSRAVGTSMISVCMDRNDHLSQALPSWIACQPQEIVIVDWGSKIPIKPLIEQYRVLSPSVPIILVTVTNVKHWVLTQAFNLASMVSNYQSLLKLDADFVLDPQFLTQHQLDKSEFFAGDWQQARNANERHLNGLVYVPAEDFFQVGGYNELITTYGYDDCDLYKRLEEVSKRRAINLDLVEHLVHDQESRVDHQDVDNRERLDIEIETNRLLSERHLWNGQSLMSTYHLVRTDPHLRTGDVSGQWLTSQQIDPTLRQQLHDQAIKNRDWVITHPPVTLKFYIEPCNGLGNRLRALASAYAIAHASRRQLVVIWRQDAHCQAKLTDLFQIVGDLTSVVIIEDPQLIAEITRQIDYPKPNHDCYPCSGGSSVTHHGQSKLHDVVVYDYFTNKNQRVDDQTKHDIYVISACVLNNPNSTWKAEINFLRQLRPVTNLQEIITYVNETYQIAKLVGVHIRMGQPANEYAYEDTSNYTPEGRASVVKWRGLSHWSNFAEEMSKFPADQKFFVCCDNPDAYQNLLQRFGNRIVARLKQSYGRGLDEVREAVIDVMLLAKTKSMLGSNWSSYSELAQRLNPNPMKFAGVDFASKSPN